MGPPLLLIHGSGPDSRAWLPVMENLARDHRVVAYDRRGFGSSSPPQGGGWAEHCIDGERVLATLVGEPAHVVGWSGGGAVAVHLAAMRPELVRGVVLAETGLARRPAVTGAFLGTVLRAKLLRRLRGDRAGIDAIMRWMLPEPGGGNSWDAYPDDARARTYGNAAGIWADFAPRRRPDLSDAHLARVRAPTTIVLGEWGQSWFRRSADALEEALPDARRVILAGTNHALAHHQPGAFADAIRQAAA